VEDALVDWSVQIETRVHLDPELADLIGMAVSRDNACRYCFAATRAFLRVLGMPESRIERLEQEMLTGEFDARERAALEFARRVSHSNPLPEPRDQEPLRAAGFEEGEITEILGVIFLHLFFNRLSTIAALPPYGMEALPDRWTVRLARPLVALSLRRVRKRARPEPLEPGEEAGPFAPAVKALDGLPMARAMRRTLDAMFTSGALPARCKALVFAVVGRALGCAASELEARSLLAGEGLADGEFDRVLDHLASLRLDDVESLAIPFARETVWYEPARIQRRARGLKDRLSREQLIELTATVAIANATCRLGAAAGQGP
jgi:AhpD family alkylhydroperoxidase